jgi:predicted nuclease with TOPRIM domain
MTITNDTYLKARLKHLQYDRDTLREQLNVWFAKLEAANEEIRNLQNIIALQEQRLCTKPCQYEQCERYAELTAELDALKITLAELQLRVLQSP